MVQNIAPPTMCLLFQIKNNRRLLQKRVSLTLFKVLKKDPRPMPKPVPSCRTNVMDGMVVRNTTSPELLEARAGVVEFFF
jgi:NADH-quinone oxidoreductase subunit G